MAIEETHLYEPSSTSLVHTNLTNEVDDGNVIWDDFVSNMSEEIPSKCGGFVLTKDNKLLAFVRTDPDAKAVNGPVNNGQYCPVDLKVIKLAEEPCTKYV
eukprot:1993496-Ditylum_brightwellii.AAC.1